MGAELLVRTIPDYVAGKLNPLPQPAEGVTHAPKIKKQDGHLDWSQPAPTLWNRVRGLVPWPGAFSYLPGQPQPHLLKIWHAEVLERSGPPGEVLQADKDGVVVDCGGQALRILILLCKAGLPLPVRNVNVICTYAEGVHKGYTRDPHARWSEPPGEWATGWPGLSPGGHVMHHPSPLTAPLPTPPTLPPCGPP